MEANTTNTLTSSDLSNIEEKLDKIIESENTNSKINDLLEEMLQEIEEYKQNN